MLVFLMGSESTNITMLCTITKAPEKIYIYMYQKSKVKLEHAKRTKSDMTYSETNLYTLKKTDLI